jgi:hypothetical protein
MYGANYSHQQFAAAICLEDSCQTTAANELLPHNSKHVHKQTPYPASCLLLPAIASSL